MGAKSAHDLCAATQEKDMEIAFLKGEVAALKDELRELKTLVHGILRTT
eukprot:SAG31_NODE_5215_length_2670_cov_1.691949_2_plen_49_part_00